MGFNRKYILITAILLANMLFAPYAFAGEFLTTLTNLINTLPVASTLFPNSIGAFLCDIRRLMCPNGGIVITIIAVNVFMIGIMILNNKISWSYVVMMTAFAILLADPEMLASQVLGITGFFPNICLCL